jgi:hypothetical protein
MEDGDDDHMEDGDNNHMEGGDNNHMAVDQEEGYNDEAPATDDEELDSLSSHEGTVPKLECPRPQPVDANVTSDEDDTGSNAGSSNAVYDASYRLHDAPVVMQFPGAAGKEYGIGDRTEDEIYQNTVGAMGGIYAPFSSKMEWEIAKWAKERGPSSTAFSDLMSIEGVSIGLLSS